MRQEPHKRAQDVKRTELQRKEPPKTLRDVIQRQEELVQKIRAAEADAQGQGQEKGHEA